MATPASVPLTNSVSEPPRRFGALDLLFLVAAAIGAGVYVVTELQLLPGGIVESNSRDLASAVNFTGLGLVGFGLLSALGWKSPGAMLLALAALVDGFMCLYEIGLERYAAMDRFFSVVYPPSFPYGFLMFVGLGFALAVWDLWRRRSGPERLSRLFFLGTFGLNGVSLLLGSAIWHATVNRNHVADAARLINWLTLVPPTVSGLMLFYGMWAAIQDGHARTTPGRALGRLFIPLYNLYWIFVVFPGFADDYNRYLQRYDLRLPPLRRVFFTLYLLLAVFGQLAQLVAGAASFELGLLVATPTLLLGRKVFGDVCGAVNSLPTHP